jgi:rhodanese-related sulfurtransferase
MPVWRALSQTVQTDMLGADYIFRGDHTAVWVDARTPAEFTAGSVPGAVNIQKGEATAANDDGRLPLQDKGTRVVVLANTPAQARVVAAEIAKKAYWNSSYFGGTFNDRWQLASSIIRRWHMRRTRPLRQDPSAPRRSHPHPLTTVHSIPTAEMS